jgi:hypothetical protein
MPTKRAKLPIASRTNPFCPHFPDVTPIVPHPFVADEVRNRPPKNLRMPSPQLHREHPFQGPTAGVPAPVPGPGASHRRGGAGKLKPLVVCCAGRRAMFGTAAFLMIDRVIRANLPRPDTFLGV